MTFAPHGADEMWKRAYLLALNEGALVIPISPVTKRPLIPSWPKQGSQDMKQIKAWWEKWSDAMIGVLTGAGSGVWALDIDDKHHGSKSLAQFEMFYGKLPVTARHSTPGGQRLFFRWPAGVTIKSRAGDISPGVDVRGGTASGQSKGQAIVPPSVRADGGRYEWALNSTALSKCADAPLWLLFLAIFSKRERTRLAECGISRPEDFGEVPVHEWLTIAREKIRPARASSELAHDLNAPQAAALIRYVESAISAECAALRHAKPGVQDVILNNAGLKIWSLLKGADATGLDTAQLEECAERDYIVAALEMAPEHGREAWEAEHAEEKWRRTEADAEPRDLMHVVQKAEAADAGFKALIVRDTSIERASIQAGTVETYLAWPDVDKNDKPIANSAANVRKLLETLAVEVRSNEFTGTIEVRWDGDFAEMNDLLLSKLWSAAQDRRLACKIDSLQRLIAVVADRNRHHPVREYLESLTWDGTPRVDAMFSTHFGAQDTLLNRAFARATLLGACRRARAPGCKHDLMPVLEGPQGSEKSTAIAVLGGSFYGDGLRLGLGAKETIEQTVGIWIAEVAELGGMQAREIENIKHHLSCQVDRARMAFERLTGMYVDN